MNVFKKIFFLVLSLVITALGLFCFSKKSNPIYAEGPIEIYTIEDLNNVRNNLSGDYLLMNDLDFNNPNSWEDYENNYDIVFQQKAEGRKLGWANKFVYSVPYFPIKEVAEVTVSGVNRNEYSEGIEGGWKVTAPSTGEISFFDVNGNPTTPETLYGVSQYEYVYVTYFVSSEYFLGWKPIGSFDYSNSAPFLGSFDGQNHSISNLYINRTEVNDLGLFGYVEGVDIQNLAVQNVYINMNGYNTGGLVGRLYGEANVINNCYTTGIIQGEKLNASTIGGLVGYAYDAQIINSHSTIDINVIDGQYMGGLVGDAYDSTISGSYATGDIGVSGYVLGGLVGSFGDGQIIKSFASGDVVGGAERGYYIGGFVGELTRGTILDSYSEGSVSGLNSTGGFVGQADFSLSNIANSFSTGVVSSIETSWAGGLVGANGGTISNSFWDTETSGMLTSDGGTGKTTSEMKYLSTFNNTLTEGLDSPWEIVDINNFSYTNPSVWYINSTIDYPRLSYQLNSPVLGNQSVSDITHNSASLSGEISSLGSFPSAEVFFQYRKSGEEWITTPTLEKTSIGSFSIPITDLSFNTTYEYRSGISWASDGVEYGEVLTFKTLIPPLPTTFGSIVSNIENILTPSNTEKELIFTQIGTGSITFPSGLDLVSNYNQLSTLGENLVVVYESSLNRYRAYVNSTGASFLATNGATIKFFNVKNQLGISGLTESNYKTLLKVNVLDDSKNIVTDTSSYYDWNNSSYNPTSDILTMPVNHFSEYVLGVNTGVLPSTGMDLSSLLIPICLISFGGVLLIAKRKKYLV